MNPRRPYNPDRRKSGSQDSRSSSLWIFIALPLLGVTLFFIFRPRAAAPQPTPFDVSSTPPPAILTLTDVPLPTVTLPPEILETSTPPPEIIDEASATPPSSVVGLPSSPTPTALLAPLATQVYLTQSGDTLPALAARFGVNPADINAPNGLQGRTTLVENQLLVIPQVLNETGPGNKIIPDSELVFSGGGAGFDPQDFAGQQGGYLATYRGFMDDMTLSGGDVLLLTAQQHSINPRLLTALLEYESGWVTNPDPQGDALAYPLGFLHTYRKELPAQLSWAASQLAIGYYGWRAGTLTELHFPDGSALRLDPTLNAGTVALQYFFAQTRNRPEWDTALSSEGFAATYQKFFGDPFARAVDPLLPADLTQPELRLPFQTGHTWYFSGGPHGAWEHGGAQAALDFAPPSIQTGCVKSEQLVTAVAPGQIVRRGSGSLLLDLDGDGREATGWVILYLHVTEQYRLPVGTFVETGDPLGHPSCEGGIATGTHVHIARKYNGEWIPADGLIPLNLSGWVTHAGEAEYEGTLTRGDETVTACTCGSAATAIKE
jgi:LasA protease